MRTLALLRAYTFADAACPSASSVGCLYETNTLLKTLRLRQLLQGGALGKQTAAQDKRSPAACSLYAALRGCLPPAYRKRQREEKAAARMHIVVCCAWSALFAGVSPRPQALFTYVDDQPSALAILADGHAMPWVTTLPGISRSRFLCFTSLAIRSLGLSGSQRISMQTVYYFTSC